MNKGKLTLHFIILCTLTFAILLVVAAIASAGIYVKPNGNIISWNAGAVYEYDPATGATTEIKTPDGKPIAGVPANWQDPQGNKSPGGGTGNNGVPPWIPFGWNPPWIDAWMTPWITPWYPWSEPVPIGYNTSWLIFTAISLMLAGGYLIFRFRKRGKLA